MMDKNIQRKILLAGTCWYELTGLWHLLLAQGYDVYCVPQGEPCASDGWNLIIVALSAEAVAGWGRHLSFIWELRVRMSGRMLVLVPERLKTLKVLLSFCDVYSGCEGLLNLIKEISRVLTEDAVHTDRFRLTEGQRRALKYLSERRRCGPLNLKRNGAEQYYHNARLAENVGVRDFRLLLLSGLDRELSSMEKLRLGRAECKAML